MKNILPMALLCMICFSCCGQKSSQDHKTFPKDQAQMLIHTFKDKNGNRLGDVYVKYIPNSKEIFSSLTITKELNGRLDTLYIIDHDKFTIPHKDKVDLQILKDGFYGYKIVLKKSDYIVLSYLRNKGKNVSDDITLEWNYEEKLFQIMKMP